MVLERRRPGILRLGELHGRQTAGLRDGLASRRAIPPMSSMFPIWLPDAQPPQGRYQRKLVGPYITVVHLRISAPPRNVVVRLYGVTGRRGGQPCSKEP
jgi:hypothetical protein